MTKKPAYHSREFHGTDGGRWLSRVIIFRNERMLTGGARELLQPELLRRGSQSSTTLGGLPMRSLGHQIVAEFYSCDKELLNDVEYIRDNMLAAAIKAGATIVTETFHHFSPHGVSGAVIIAESHLAIHTWPEYGYAAVDLFTCGDTVSSDVGFQHLRQALKAGHVSTMELHRGQVDMMGAPSDEVHHKPMKLVQGAR